MTNARNRRIAFALFLLMFLGAAGWFMYVDRPAADREREPSTTHEHGAMNGSPRQVRTRESPMADAGHTGSADRGSPPPSPDSPAATDFALSQSPGFRLVENWDSPTIDGEIVGQLTDGQFLVSRFIERVQPPYGDWPIYERYVVGSDLRKLTTGFPTEVDYDDRRSAGIKAILNPGGWTLWAKGFSAVNSQFFWSSNDTTELRELKGVTRRIPLARAGPKQSRVEEWFRSDDGRCFHWSAPGEIAYLRNRSEIVILDVMRDKRRVIGPFPCPEPSVASETTDQSDSSRPPARPERPQCPFLEIYAIRADPSFVIAFTINEILIIDRRGGDASVIGRRCFRHCDDAQIATWLDEDEGNSPHYYAPEGSRRCLSLSFSVCGKPGLFVRWFWRFEEPYRWLIVAVDTDTHEVTTHEVDATPFGSALGLATLGFVDFERRIAYFTCGARKVPDNIIKMPRDPYNVNDHVIVAVSIDRKASQPVAVYEVKEPGSGIVGISAGPNDGDVLALIETAMGRKHLSSGGDMSGPEGAPRGWYSRLVKLTPP